MSAPLPRMPGKVTMEGRKKLTLTGATEVVSFDEGFVELNTDLGAVIIEGAGMKLKCLSLEDGTVVVEGELSGLRYPGPGRKKGLLR